MTGYKYVWGLLAVFGIVCSVRSANTYDDWAQENAVNLNATASQNTADNNLSAPMLQRIKQESQTCGVVEVNLMRRPLNADKLGIARVATGGTAAHVQVVAIDKSTGKVVDNFGVTGDFGGGGRARIFSEDNLDKYDSKPCGTYEMSSDDYYAAKERTIKQIEGGAIYEPYSGVGLKDLAKVGAEAGEQVAAPLGPIASVAGAIAGAVGGAMAANDIYETKRHDYGIHSDSDAKMSFPIVNCQAGGDMFVKNLEGLPTVVPVNEYVQPGEKAAQLGGCRDEAEDIVQQKKTLHTNGNAEGEKISASQRTNTVNDIQEPESIGSNSVGVRGWCNCGDNHGKRYIVGDMFCMYDKLKCDLAYTMCARCGCVVRPKDCVGNGLQIVDLSLYRELKRRNGGRLAWSDAFRPLKTRQSEIEAMPNGQIIVGGVCVCKETDPIKVGFTNKITGEFFVCCLCGRVREPDRNGDMPTGTTALSEMGLHEQAEKAGERIGNWLEGRSNCRGRDSEVCEAGCS